MDDRPNLEHDVDAMTDLARVTGRYHAALLNNGISESLANDLVRDWHGRHMYLLSTIHDLARDAHDAAREVRKAMRDLRPQADT
jgi:hypothetical protein